MKIAIISDIHGNLEAFQDVLTDINRSGVDDLISLGDNIGYGPDPEQVIHLIRNRNIPSVMGNHELAIINHDFLTGLTPPPDCLWKKQSGSSLKTQFNTSEPRITRWFLTGAVSSMVSHPTRPSSIFFKLLKTPFIAPSVK